MSLTISVFLVWFVLAFLDSTTNGHRYNRRNATKLLNNDANASEGLNASEIDHALTAAEMAEISKLLTEYTEDPPAGMSLRSIVTLLHELDNDQKRYEMKLAENRVYRERLLRWLLCDKNAAAKSQPNRVFPDPMKTTVSHRDTTIGRHDMNSKKM